MFCKTCKEYIQTLRHFKTRIKENLPDSELKFIKQEPEIKTIPIKKESKVYLRADNLIDNRDWAARKCKISRLKNN